MNRYTKAFGSWTPRAVVFDCDGLLLDTESVWNRTQRTILGRLDAHLDAQQEERVHGASLEDAAEIIAEAAGAPYEDVLAQTREQFVADLADELVEMPGAAAVVRATASRVPIACASNSWHEALVDKLSRAGLLDAFSDLQSTDTVERGKPDPAMYAQGAAALGAAPADTLALEDSRVGARSALGAGLRLLAVPGDGPAIEGADLSIPSLDDPELLEWIATWPQRPGAHPGE